MGWLKYFNRQYNFISKLSVSAIFFIFNLERVSYNKYRYLFIQLINHFHHVAFLCRMLSRHPELKTSPGKGRMNFVKLTSTYYNGDSLPIFVCSQCGDDTASLVNRAPPMELMPIYPQARFPFKLEYISCGLIWRGLGSAKSI